MIFTRKFLTVYSFHIPQVSDKRDLNKKISVRHFLQPLFLFVIYFNIPTRNAFKSRTFFLNLRNCCQTKFSK